MDYDQVIVYLGEFGRYQKLITVACCCLGIPGSVIALSIVFLGANVDYRCATPELNHLNLSDAILRNLSSPIIKNGEYDDACFKYELNTTTWTEESAADYLLTRDVSQLTTVDCRSHGGWVYDTSQYKSSIVTEWGLVCDLEWLTATAASVYMAGIGVGVVVFGTIADIWGRRKVLYVSTVLFVATSIAVSFSPDYVTFVTLRFFLAMFVMASYTTAFVIVMEMVGEKWRVVTGMMPSYFWALGYVLVPLAAYYVREWNWLQLALSLPQLILLPLLFFIPESPRWLYAQGRPKEAQEILAKMARVNCVKLPEKLEVSVTTEGIQKAYPWDMVRTPRMRFRSIITFFIWFVCSLVYYGLALNTSNLGGNDYVNFLIAGALEFPAYTCSIICLKFMGRRWTVGTALLISGLALLGTMVVTSEMNTLSVSLAMLGKFFVTMSFANMYIFSAEVFPTVMRNVGVATGSFFSRIGGLLAPFIAKLSVFGKTVPLIVFGVLSLLAGVSCLFLPETNGKKLPETIEDGEIFGGKGYIPSDFWRCGTSNEENEEVEKMNPIAS